MTTSRFSKVVAFLAAIVAVLAMASPARAAAGYWYAGGQQALTGGNTVSGLSANIWIADPYLETVSGKSMHSLMSISLQDANGSAVEFGWQKDTAGNPPYLFATYFDNGTWCGSATACSGWVDNGGNAINNGSSLAAYACNSACTLATTVKAFSFYYTTGACGASASGWFLYFAGSNIGCFPPTVFTSGFTTGVNARAQAEVYYGDTDKPCSDMGNGKDSGALGTSGPAYFGSVGYIGSAGPAAPFSPSLTLVQTDAAAYTTINVGSTGNRTFGAGGKGYTGSPRATPGVLNGC